MGIFDTVITLAALGVGSYFTVYYLIPALNQLNANASAQTPAPAAAPAPYIPPPAAEAPYIPPEADTLPPPEPLEDLDTITDEEKSELEDEVDKLKKEVEKNEKEDEKKDKDKDKKKEEEKKKPKEETLSDMIEKAKKPKVVKLPKGGSTIENEAANYASVLDIYRNL